MKILLLITILITSLPTFAQKTEKISTIDYVQVLNGNRAETLFYYQNNWEELRKEALDKSYIHGYQLLQIPLTEEYPFEFMLITTYPNQSQYELREGHFSELIKAHGETRLLNEKQKSDFRKILFNKDKVRHLN